ncbi:hypothetical protein HUT19_03900 [Streptomyces sp. NA02950]|uniref:hypothetical protein n=1 Tax=Streptomyces sp. NA02950 TaxID=2742137 RepID=UPI0015926144|nr:hypothetical protein [Streptomyces sp. NA02950]QKV90989.1 hypothetical protein HUT19_03900 [Streptomyces sp. NA02950]
MSTASAVPGPISAPPEVHGALETHVTVACPPHATDRLAAWAAARGFGFTHIVLARGRTPSQPMLNLRGDGPATVWRENAARVAAELAADGFRPVRIKTEAAPWAAGVPRDDTAAAAHGPGRYFEHHIKLLLPAEQDRAPLERLAVPHGAHVSWNARRFRDDGRQERFITQRCHGVGRATAERRLSALLGTLHTAALQLLEAEREFVLHDTNLGLDDGWITEEPTP